jgi:flagellar assembly factor FliW
MQLETRRFGVIEVDPNDEVVVPTGIPGFPDLRRVVLLGVGTAPGQEAPADEFSLYWMQDLDDGDLAFLCVVPWPVFPEYDIDIDDQALGIAEDGDVAVLVLVTTRREDGAAHMTANLRAPLVVDMRRRVMQQVILTDSKWPIRAPFAALTSDEVR